MSTQAVVMLGDLAPRRISYEQNILKTYRLMPVD